MIYGGVFLVGYLLANMYSGWERQRFVESWVDSNKVESLLRVGLADELDRLYRDLAAVAGPLRCRAVQGPAGRFRVRGDSRSTDRRRPENRDDPGPVRQYGRRRRRAPPVPARGIRQGPREPGIHRLRKKPRPRRRSRSRCRPPPSMPRKPRSRRRSRSRPHPSMPRSRDHESLAPGDQAHVCVEAERAAPSVCRRPVFAQGGRVPGRAGHAESAHARGRAPAVDPPRAVFELLLPEPGQRAGGVRGLDDLRAVHQRG